MSKDPSQENKQSLQPIAHGASFIRWLGSIFKLIKYEVLFGILGLILTLGQYFQSGISIRINITSIWREGYTAENRNRVAKFRLLYKQRTEICKQQQCHNTPDESVYNLASSAKLFKEDFIKGDEFIRTLVSDEIELLRIERKVSCDKTPEVEKQTTDKFCIGNEDYIKAALKYRNAIIETLNTAEAVKAVIESRPLPLRQHILYSDTLEGRYKDIIQELTSDLGSFIHIYRALQPRETPAWFVLTSEESQENVYIVIWSYIYVLILILTIVYLLKRQFERSGGKQHSP